MFDNEEEFLNIEEKERELTEEELLAMFLLLDIHFRDAEQKIRDFYSRYGSDGVVTVGEARKWISRQDHRKRLNVLLTGIMLNPTKTLRDLKPHFKNMVKGINEIEADFFKVEPEQDLSPSWGADDKDWLGRLEYDISRWNWYIMEDLKQSIYTQKPMNKTVDKLAERFGKIKRALKALVYTESTAVGSVARLKAFRKMGITRYQFYTKADERVCPHCGSMHGAIFPISAYQVGVTASPIHGHCRCFEVPLFDGQRTSPFIILGA